jgi:uncharacterized membrane protein
LADSREEEKRSLIAYKKATGKKSLTFGAGDYRGLIALLLSVAFVTALFLGNIDGIAALGPLAGSAATYYFHEKVMEKEF